MDGKRKVTTLEKRVICLHQFIRPKYSSNIIVEGYGNCVTCKQHPDNKYCNGYIPIRVYIFEVKDAIDKKTTK